MDKVAEWMKAHNIRRVINHELQLMRPKSVAERQQMLKNYAKYKGMIERFTIIEPQEVDSVEAAVKILEREKADGAIGFVTCGMSGVPPSNTLSALVRRNS